MIEEAYVSFEVAKLLIEKGFNEPTLAYAYGQDMISYYSRPKVTDPLSIVAGRIPLPTQQMACEWLRQEHNLSVEVYRTACGWIGCVVAIPSGTDLKFLEDDGDDLPSGQYTTHAKACEATIKYCLENLIKEGELWARLER